MHHDGWSVLMVCTGNICRSPMAELIVQAALGSGPAAGVAVGSAGVHGWEGHPMHPHALAALADLGLDGRAFRARMLTTALVDEADVVLCATRAHRAAVVTVSPRSVRRCFTMREFARLTAEVTPIEIAGGPPREVGARLVAAALRRRAVGEVVAAAVDDIGDPVAGNLDTFRDCAQAVADALARPFDMLARALRVDSAPPR